MILQGYKTGFFVYILCEGELNMLDCKECEEWFKNKKLEPLETRGLVVMAEMTLRQNWFFSHA